MATAAVDKRIPKPVMRGLYNRKIKIHFVGAVTCSVLAGLAWKILYMDPKKVAFEKWMKYYDPDKHQQIMHEAGLLQSWPKDS